MILRSMYAACSVAMREEYASQPPESFADWVDWEATARIRSDLDADGLGIAEAMDTAQRFDLGWEFARELIERAGAMRLARPFFAGAGSDTPGREPAESVILQAECIRSHGGIPVLYPLPELAGRNEQAFVDHYAQVIDALPGPLVVHWLGGDFRADLAGYFPGESFAQVMAHDPAKVLGCKISLLNAAREREIRDALLPSGQLVFTGDDWNFSELIIEGGAAPVREVNLAGASVALGPFSHALLGAFSTLGKPVRAALASLERGQSIEALALLKRCEPYARHVFGAPTPDYKAGLAFTHFLAGRQSNPMLPLRHDRSRSREHLLRAGQLALEANAFAAPTEAQERLEAWAGR